MASVIYVHDLQQDSNGGNFHVTILKQCSEDYALPVQPNEAFLPKHFTGFENGDVLTIGLF